MKKWLVTILSLCFMTMLGGCGLLWQMADNSQRNEIRSLEVWSPIENDEWIYHGPWEVTVPEEYVGNVIGDLSTRRGRIDGQEQRGNVQAVRAFVPLAEMFGYATALRSNTQGRGNYTMQFDHYEECPRFVAEEIIKKRNS